MDATLRVQLILFGHPQNHLCSKIQNKLLPNFSTCRTAQHWNVHLQSVVNSTTQINLFWMTVRSGENTQESSYLMAMIILAEDQLKLMKKTIWIQIYLQIVWLGAIQNNLMEHANTDSARIIQVKNAKSRLQHHLQLGILFIQKALRIHTVIHMLFKNHLRRTWETYS